MLPDTSLAAYHDRDEKAISGNPYCIECVSSGPDLDLARKGGWFYPIDMGHIKPGVLA